MITIKITKIKKVTIKMITIKIVRKKNEFDYY